MADNAKVRVLNTTNKPSAVGISAVDLSKKLQKLMLRMKGEFMTADGTGVKYEALKISPLFKDYKAEACHLQLLDLKTLNEVQKKVFFINIYNALVIHGLAELDTLPQSVLKVQQFFRTTAYNIGGLVYSLDDMEHGILRGNRPHPASVEPFFNNKDPRLPFVVQKLDPRIHFALVCGAKSCPAINVYTEENLETALDGATKSFCEQHTAFLMETNEIWLSQIFQWYRADFGEKESNVIRWIMKYLSKEKHDTCSLMLMQLERMGTVKVLYEEYNWQLNVPPLTREEIKNMKLDFPLEPPDVLDPDKIVNF